MVDDRMIERLSQYIDGDLDPTEARDFEALLEAEPALRAELSALQDLRRSLARLADREHPPAVLDALIEPLMQSGSAAVAARPWAKWLAAAAAVVLGATIVFEVNRKEFGPTPSRYSKPVEEKRRVEPVPEFQASPDSPHPTGEGDRPRGAIDRLLAAAAPEVDILPDDPPALEVIGPLQTQRGDSRNQKSRPIPDSGTDRSAAADVNAPEAKNESPRDEPGKAQSVPSSTRQRLGEERLEGMEIEHSSNRAKLFVFMEEKTAWQSFEPGIRCESGRYSLRIRMENGFVREVWPVGRPPAAPSQHLRAGEIILGLELDGVPDGEFAAEVTIEPRSRHR